MASSEGSITSKASTSSEGPWNTYKVGMLCSGTYACSYDHINWESVGKFALK